MLTFFPSLYMDRKAAQSGTDDLFQRQLIHIDAAQSKPKAATSD